MLAASGTAAAAEEELDFKRANIDHVSIQVADLQAILSLAFYQKMFGFSVINQDQPFGKSSASAPTRSWFRSIVKAPLESLITSQSVCRSTPRRSAARYLPQRGAIPLDDPYAGLHVKNPDGNNVQVFSQR